MLGNFTYCNPTKLYFGKNALDGLNKELPRYGKNIMLIYGGGSIKKNGIYDKVVDILKRNGFKGDFHDIAPTRLISALLTDPILCKLLPNR